MPSDVSFATKNEIALTLIQEALADQCVQAPVLADAAYGNSYAFRAHLRELNLEFFVQVTPEEHIGWIEEVPTTLKGKYRIVDQQSAPKARSLFEIAASYRQRLGSGVGGKPLREQDNTPA